MEINKQHLECINQEITGMVTEMGQKTAVLSLILFDSTHITSVKV